ncbi:MAG: amino acid--tRNA ligase-related protein, partial [Spirochaetaceae bacterium]|nr:amino acid--tRNA ligase-related protein [Spirochaetaceae bacterium]
MPFRINPVKDRAKMYRALRDYFDRCGFLEVETPLLTPAPIPESHIELFRTERITDDESPSPLFLVPSPEVWLKILLSEGAPSLYEIGRCFRNGEQLDRWHRLEFTMLEWYGIGASAEKNITEMQNVLTACINAVNPGAPAEISAAFRVLSMEEVFRDFAGFSLESDLVNAGLVESNSGKTDSQSAEAYMMEAYAADVLGARLKEHGLPGCGETDSAADLFHRLFLTLVEEALPADRPLILTDWPALVPTLARRIPGTPWAERWELYVRNVEVANCYGEETDEMILRDFWDSEADAKSGSAVRADFETDWPELVAKGLPSCSGVAVGLDRLLALIRGDQGLG